jgi:hypothetical protein
VEDGLLENVEIPNAPIPFRPQSNGYQHSDSNGSTSGVLFLYQLDSFFVHLLFSFW